MSPVRGASFSLLQKALISIAYPSLSPALLHNTPDWDDVAKSADEHSISPSLYQFARNLPAIPSKAADGFRERSIRAIAQAEFAWEVLGELKDVLVANGPCVIIQGLSLLESVYPPNCARFLGDIDLYLPNADWDRVGQGLRAYGFRPWLHYANVWKRDGLTLDLHASLWGEERIPRRAFIAPGNPVAFCPSSRCPEYSLLPAEWMLVHSIYHAAKHGFSKLLWDLDLLFLREALDFALALPKRASPLVKLARARIAMLCAPESFQRPGLGLLRDRILLQVMKEPGHPALGEIAISMLAGTWGQTFRYLADSAIPNKKTLLEMYGNHGMASLLLRRIGALLSKASA